MKARTGAPSRKGIPQGKLHGSLRARIEPGDLEQSLQAEGLSFYTRGNHEASWNGLPMAAKSAASPVHLGTW